MKKIILLIIFSPIAFSQGLAERIDKYTIIDCQEPHPRCKLSSFKVIDEKWNNTVLKNCKISGKRTGIVIKGVINFSLDSCKIKNITKGSGIYFDPNHPSKKVFLKNNTLKNIAKNGIVVPRGSVSELVIADNKLTNIAKRKLLGLHHGIYIQVPNSIIENNKIDRVYDGNGIAIRSSAIIRKNQITETGKSGIGYYNDHPSPDLAQLIISNNNISNYGRHFKKRAGIEVLLTSPKYSPIYNVVIKNNKVQGDRPVSCRSHRNCSVE